MSLLYSNFICLLVIRQVPIPWYLSPSRTPVPSGPADDLGDGDGLHWKTGAPSPGSPAWSAVRSPVCSPARSPTGPLLGRLIDRLLDSMLVLLILVVVARPCLCSPSSCGRSFWY